MKLLSLNVYQSCNYKCVDCPMAPWIYEKDAVDQDGKPFNSINNDILLVWIDKYLNPQEWLIEITGGEPGLYPEIEELMFALSERQYRGIVRTNGSLPLPRTSNIKRVTAWHKQMTEIPKQYDYIVILTNPEDDWERKRDFCIDNKIPHVVLPYQKYYYTKHDDEPAAPVEKVLSPEQLITHMTTVWSSGSMGGCFTKYIPGKSLHNMDAPSVEPVCAICPSMDSVDFFMRELFKDDDIVNSHADREKTYNMERGIEGNFIVYPMLNLKNQWERKDGTIVGKLGDNIDFASLKEIDNIFEYKGV
ncbi:MAG: hypothetical protein FWB73_02910 [Treponema sp.]|nr:hypothetical protein [Treponema sp.]